MADYLITFARSARKELENLSEDISDRILEKIGSLTTNPRPPGAVKLQGRKDFWRVRIGDYRAVYSIDDASKKIDITIIRHRRDVYRDL